MLRRKIRESLTARIFLLTFAILFAASAITFSLIAWATPITYTSVVSRQLLEKSTQLAESLKTTPFQESGALLDRFIQETGAVVMVMDSQNALVETPSKLAVQPRENGEMDVGIYFSQEENSAYSIAVSGPYPYAAADSSAVSVEISFADREGPYVLSVSPQAVPANQAVEALGKAAPWLLLAMAAFSLLCSLFYSRYIARPIVRLSAISQKMANLDFDWECGETRRDEIGTLGRSLNQMSRRLSSSLSQLQEANQALRQDMERERELERRRTAFFSAASHELKTPVTILRGQLTGMLEGVGVYRDRDKYLGRALQTTARMEGLIQELLAVSRIESGSFALHCAPVELSALAERQLALDAPLLEQRGQRLEQRLAPGLSVQGNQPLLQKALGNLISNASFYSPSGAVVRVTAEEREGRPALTVENTGAHIAEEALPHLFEAFYRAEQSRSRRTGGSGLGLYLVKMILERHSAEYAIENTGDGVRFTILFPGGQQPDT